MKTKIILTIGLISTFLVTSTALAQCTNAATFGQFPLETFDVTVCNGTTPNEISTSCYAGEYSKVNLEANKTYTFSSSNLTDFITVSNEIGSVAFVSGQTPVSFQSTTNQVVRFYTHTNSLCGEENVSRARYVTCQPPTGCANGQLYPPETYVVPICDGETANLINSDAFAGEYAFVTLQNNKAYSLRSSNLSDIITVTNFDGTQILGFGQTPFLFVPTTAGDYRFYLHTDYFCGVDVTNRSRFIVCYNNVGITEEVNENWSVYPNPATTELSVQSTEPIEEIKLFGIDGKLIENFGSNGMKTTFSIAQIQAGTYYLSVTISGQKQLKELIIQ